MTLNQLRNYFLYVVRHKWFVFRQGQMLGAPIWRLIIHDWSKFLPDEFIAYAKCFNSPQGEPRYLPTYEFAVAWNKHINRNDHHYQHWVLEWDSGKIEPLKIPIDCVLEMIADWSGANLARGGDGNPKTWLEKKVKDNSLSMNPETLQAVRDIIDLHWN